MTGPLFVGVSGGEKREIVAGQFKSGGGEGEARSGAEGEKLVNEYLLSSV